MTLDDVRARIAELARDLDPSSRYRRELLAIVAASADVADLERRLGASRGARHAGASVFARMSLDDQLRCNLVTNETVLFRFSEGEWEVLVGLLGRLRGRVGRILSAPCSHGEEAFSIAAACLHEGVEFLVDAVDVQAACIDAARTGRLSLGFPEQWLAQPAIVGPEVLGRVRFAQADLCVAPGGPGGPPGGPYDLVVCRNFLGYWTEPRAMEIAVGLARRVGPGGALFVDAFCLRKFTALSAAFRACGLARVADHPVFVAA